MMDGMENIAELAKSVMNADRRALSQAITLIESSREDHRIQAMELMDKLRLPNKKAIRIGLSGTPGVGKSTFIESFGTYLTGIGLRVAVLAVDPSSVRSGGSILGDKTRMERLVREPNAFIRPSPSRTHLGGVAKRSREAVTICEAAGFDVIFIETVGVGQSETIVSEISDVFLLLIAPAGGDELQGVKRGIMEIADLILVNKADGDLKAAASRTCSDYASSLMLLRKRRHDPEGFPLATTISALEEVGLADVWSKIEQLVDWRKSDGWFDHNRKTQSRFWFKEEIRQGLLSMLDKEEVKEEISLLMNMVDDGEIYPSAAAQKILKKCIVETD
jgi:LAO/AO transport system kinase